MSSEKKPIRWWPAAVVLILAGAVLAFVWLRGGNMDRQMRMMSTYALVFLAGLLLLLWALLLSRLGGWIRLSILVAAVLVVVLLGSLVKVHGVTGDWIPILTWKWSPPPDAALERGAAGTATAAAVASSPDDFPQFLGPARNATISGVVLRRDWEAEAPELLWRQKIGAGWSGFAVVGAVAVTLEQRGPYEMVTAYDLETGRELWSHADETRFDQNSWVGGVGPRSTPTVADGAVYTLGATGILNRLDLASGERRWQRDVADENRAQTPEWGRSSSPLVLGELVVVNAGGGGGRSLVAYDRETGEPVWSGGSDRASYSSPLLASLAGKEQIVVFNGASVAGHDPADGRLLWHHPWSKQQPNVAQPLPLGDDRLLVSSGYGVGSKLFQVLHENGAWRVDLLWETPRLKAKFTQVVEHGGSLYGLDDGVLTAIDPATGERLWKRGRYGHGQVLLVGDVLLLQSERGKVVLIEPSPDELREVASFQALDGKVWNPPTLAGPYLLVRNDLEAACYRLPIDS